MSTLKATFGALLVLFAGAAFASEGFAVGQIRQLTYRGGYVSFKVVGDGEVNYCSACPTDPGLQGSQKCWIPDAQKSELAVLLLAKAQSKGIVGRVYAFATDCTVYEMTMQD